VAGADAHKGVTAYQTSAPGSHGRSSMGTGVFFGRCSTASPAEMDTTIGRMAAMRRPHATSIPPNADYKVRVRILQPAACRRRVVGVRAHHARPMPNGMISSTSRPGDAAATGLPHSRAELDERFVPAYIKRWPDGNPRVQAQVGQGRSLRPGGTARSRAAPPRSPDWGKR